MCSCTILFLTWIALEVEEVIQRVANINVSFALNQSPCAMDCVAYCFKLSIDAAILVTIRMNVEEKKG